VRETTDVCLVLCTAPAAAAQHLADALLEQRVAACVNLLGPVQSRYWWQGRIEQADETLLLIKSRRPLLDALRQAVRAAHPYEVPELLVFAVDAGLDEYLDWVAASCRPDRAGS
jgi:periplasmic divalent cation tolerance protein